MQLKYLSLLIAIVTSSCRNQDTEVDPFFNYPIFLNYVGSYDAPSIIKSEICSKINHLDGTFHLSFEPNSKFHTETGLMKGEGDFICSRKSHNPSLFEISLSNYRELNIDGQTEEGRDFTANLLTAHSMETDFMDGFTLFRLNIESGRQMLFCSPGQIVIH